MPLGYCRPTPLQDIIAKMVRQAVSDENHEEFESEKDANDFEPEDEELLDMSPYTLSNLQEEEPISEPSQPEPENVAPEPEPEPKPTIGDPPNPKAEEPD